MKAKLQNKKIPEDLGLVIMTKDEEYWSKVVKETEQQFKVLKGRLRFEEAVLNMAQKELKKAQKQDK
jgi:hypothetical protein